MRGTVEQVLAGEARYHVAACRAEALLDSLPDGCVSLIATDPPFHKVKDEAWDREHKTVDGFLGWMGEILDRFRRVLAPNGSLYVFASPKMAWGVEGEVRRRFEVLSRVTWEKERDRGKHAQSCKEALRAYFPNTEAVIFAEQSGGDLAVGSGWDLARDRLRGEVFEPLRAYLDAERRRAGVSKEDCNEALGFSRSPGGMASRHYFSRSQWWMPTRSHYESLRRLFRRNGGDCMEMSYDEMCARRELLELEFESRARELDSLRRPFTVSAEVPYTDVWTYPTVARYPGKHACEKPWHMGLDIVRASSRADGVVLDCFAGGGTFPAAAAALRRRVIACDMDPHWADVTRDRCARALVNPEAAKSNRVERKLPAKATAKPVESPELPLFAAS